MIIALTGSKGSGKDEFFKIAAKNFPQLNICKIAFADPIKHEIINIFNLESEDQYDRLKRTNLYWTSRMGQNTPHEVSGRHLVREIGMLMRSYDEDQFVEYVMNEVASEPQSVWVITDLRFDNELEAIKKANGIIIKVVRKGMEYDGHATETEIRDEDCTSIIHNDNTLVEYESKIIDVMNSIFVTLSIN